MATRGTVTFTDAYESHIVYIHHDNYPSHRAASLWRFRARLNKVGHRGCASEEAARFVVFMFEEYREMRTTDNTFSDREAADYDLLETFSVKLAHGIPGDTDFDYEIDMTGPSWRVTCNGKEIDLNDFE